MMHTIRKSKYSNTDAPDEAFDVGYLARLRYGDVEVDEFTVIFTQLSFRAALMMASFMNGGAGVLPELVSFVHLKDSVK